jgi:hypothetical protein
VVIPVGIRSIPLFKFRSPFFTAGERGKLPGKGRGYFFYCPSAPTPGPQVIVRYVTAIPQRAQMQLPVRVLAVM